MVLLDAVACNVLRKWLLSMIIPWIALYSNSDIQAFPDVKMI